MIQQDISLDAYALLDCEKHWNIARRIRHEKKVRRRDLPPIVVCCTDGNIIAGSYTHGPTGCVYHDLVKNALITKLGPIGKKTNYCDFIIGRCAEPNAANKLVKRSRGTITDLGGIRFSTPFRPFTKEPRSYCPNCEHTF